MDDERQPSVQESRQRLVGAVVGAFEDARFEARQASRHEDLADDARGPAELAKWERIDQLFAAAPAGTVYAPDADDVVQAEPGPDTAAAADWEAELREALPAPTSSMRCAAPWSRPSPATVTKSSGRNSPVELAATSRPTSAAGSCTPWLRTAGTIAPSPPERKPPAFWTPPVLAHAARSPNLLAWSPAPTSTSWRSRPGSPPPSPKPPARSPRSSAVLRR
ncbi:hypothetical protein ACFYXC_38195 [Streptomyces sp. NPDC002701]|uniref:hypothetical protein n=1 Tax=Streptomyces sp. NPDC002701 TaxID=3364661 RepID=UPI0036BCE68D